MSSVLKSKLTAIRAYIEGYHSADTNSHVYLQVRQNMKKIISVSFCVVLVAAIVVQVIPSLIPVHRSSEIYAVFMSRLFSPLFVLISGIGLGLGLAWRDGKLANLSLVALLVSLFYTVVRILW